MRRASSAAGYSRRPWSFAVKAKLFPPGDDPNGPRLRWRDKGTQTIHAITVNGAIAIRRRVWWAAAQGCRAPLDEWLGLAQKYSQGVREMVCRIGLDGSYRKARADLDRLSQIRLSYQTVRAVFQREGHQVHAATQTGQLKPTFTAADCQAPGPDSTCLITGADGFQVPLITDDEQRRRREKAKQRRRRLRQKGHDLRPLPPRPKGAEQRWKEAKLVTFYDPRGRHQHTAATTGDCRAAGRLMRHHAAQLHLDQADRKYSVSDGAEWIRRQYQQQLPMLDAMILDYYHFRDHAVGCAQTLYGEGTDMAREWRKAFCTTMVQVGPLEALTQLGDLIKTHRGVKRQALGALQGYIAGRTEMLEYPRYLAEDFAIGSGPTESQCKGLTARLKGRGRRWHTQAIEAHLAISCLYSNTGQWAAYWPKIPMP
jgi:hypothetical protein